MLAKDASHLIPRYQSGENIANYVKKIRTAWTYCASEGLTEEKFCQILRLHLPVDAAEIMDSLPDEKMNNVNDVTTALLSVLDQQNSEYLQEFSSARKKATESYSGFALRLKRLYSRGTGQSAITVGENHLICEHFLNGLQDNDATALRLVATEEEMSNVTLLAKRAAKCRGTPGGSSRTITEEINLLQNEIENLKVTLDALNATANDEENDYFGKY